MCVRMANWIARWRTRASATWSLQCSVPVWQTRLDTVRVRVMAYAARVRVLLCKCSEPLNKENIRRAAVSHVRSSGCCGRDRRTEHVCVGDPSTGGRGEPRVDDPRILQTCSHDSCFSCFRHFSTCRPQWRGGPNRVVRVPSSCDAADLYEQSCVNYYRASLARDGFFSSTACVWIQSTELVHDSSERFWKSGAPVLSVLVLSGH
jgi:hypothetical protein